jgi:hypothetical protein
LPATGALLLVLGGLLTLRVVGLALEVVARYPFIPFAILVAGCAVATARRKARVYRSLVDSWLAPLPAPSSIVTRMALAPVLQLLLFLGAIAIPALAGSLSRAGVATLGSTVGAAYVVGSIIGWFSPRDAAVAAPDFHYVAVRKERMNWAQAPRLTPLSYWAVGQARVSTKPKVIAIALLFVLLSIPKGAGGEKEMAAKAMASAGGALVILYLISLCVSAVRVAFAAARWLAPTIIRYLPFTGALGYRALLAQVGISARVVFLTYAVALRGAARAALSLSVSCLLLSCVAIAGACWLAMKSAGMGSAGTSGTGTGGGTGGGNGH